MKQLKNAIYDYFKTNGEKAPHRSHLGASMIGHYCEKYLYLNINNTVKEDVSGRIYKLFNNGNNSFFSY